MLHLIENPHLIPKSWKRDRFGTRFVTFFGTIYLSDIYEIEVFAIFWDGTRWRIDANYIPELVDSSVAVIKEPNWFKKLLRKIIEPHLY